MAELLKYCEILGIKKLDLIDLYDVMGFPYFDMDITDVLRDIQTKSLQEWE